MLNNEIDKSSVMSRSFGLGATPTDTGAMDAAFGCPFTQVPVLEYVTLTVPLPLSDTAVTATFGDTINVLNVGQSAPPGVASVDFELRDQRDPPDEHVRLRHRHPRLR